MKKSLKSNFENILRFNFFITDLVKRTRDGIATKFDLD